MLILHVLIFLFYAFENSNLNITESFKQESDEVYFCNDLKYTVITNNENKKSISIIGSKENSLFENFIFPSFIKHKGIELPVTKISNKAFSYNNNIIGTIQLPTQLERIENRSFQSCHNLSGSLVIPSTVSYIGSYAFFNCYQLTSVELSKKHQYQNY